MRRQPPARRRQRGAILRVAPWPTVAIALFALVLSHPLWLPAIGGFLVVSDPLEPAHAILSLAGEPERVHEAASIFSLGLAPAFLVSNLPRNAHQADDRYLASVIASAVERGVPASQIVVVPGVGVSTYEEALNVRRFVEANDVDSLIVVTSPWHTRRSRMVFRDVFRGTALTVRVHPVPSNVYAAGGWYQPDRWWQRPSDRAVTLSEYLKIAAFMVGIR